MSDTMYLTKANLAVVKTAGADARRLTLMALRVEADGATVATDGHLLARVGALPANKDSVPLAPFSLEVGDVAALAKMVTKSAMAELDVTATNANGHVALAVGSTTLAPRKQDRDYPDCRQVYPKEAPVVVEGVAVELLARLCAILKDAGVKAVALHIRPDHAPLHFCGTTASGQEFSALLMPYKLTEEQTIERRPS